MTSVETTAPGSQSVPAERLLDAAEEFLHAGTAPTRVPASIVVRMNSASNMIAK